MEANNNKITCPKCNSQNVQSEGMIHLCMDCGYKWEDEVQTDFGEMIIYQSDEGVKLDVRLENKTVWLNIEQIAQLFNKGRATISEHISNIFKEGELEEKVVCRKFRQTTQHGALEGKTQSKEVKYYNLDVIISVGYRVKSIQGTRFRQWATERLHEYIVKGFTMDDERLKKMGGGSYWKELLDRIRDIRPDRDNEIPDPGQDRNHHAKPPLEQHDDAADKEPGQRHNKVEDGFERTKHGHEHINDRLQERHDPLENFHETVNERRNTGNNVVPDVLEEADNGVPITNDDSERVPGQEQVNDEVKSST